MMKGGVRMVIANSNISMSSSRSYQKQVYGTRFSSTRKGNNFNLKLENLEENVSENESYESQYCFGNNAFATPNYNRSGLFDKKLPDYLKTDLEEEADTTSPTSTEAVKTPMDIEITHVKSIREIYAEVTRKLYLSLLDFLESLSLRGMMDKDDRLSALRAGIDTNDNGSGRISMTNSANPTLWSVSYSESSYFFEEETTTFSTTGTVQTADGRSIEFGVDMMMSRSFMESRNIDFYMGNDAILTDPLVINLDSCPTTISDQKFLFDLDCDGKEEAISIMNSGSGYLALDLNNDGIINDGSELFGTKSGDAFADLEKYDSDGNGWIDEADDIYDSLKVWVKNPDGSDKLMSLREADVGAIHLGRSNTRFDMTDSNNETLARVKSTGIFLHESGAVGTVSQIDF